MRLSRLRLEEPADVVDTTVDVGMTLTTPAVEMEARTA